VSGVRFDFTNKLQVRQGVVPQSIAGATVNGTGIDCVDLVGDLGLEVSVGAIGTSVDAKFQESDLLASGYADFAIPAAIPQITVANSVAMVRGLRTKRFVRAVVTTVGSASLVSANILAFKKAQ
jgi:hypothetical protein